MQHRLRGVLIGAAFLMATSAIGPGFLTQTATFSKIAIPADRQIDARQGRRGSPVLHLAGH